MKFIRILCIVRLVVDEEMRLKYRKLNISDSADVHKSSVGSLDGDEDSTNQSEDGRVTNQSEDDLECSRLLNRDVDRGDEYSDLLKEEPQDDESLPRSIFFIIGNEFCERFSYYGLKTVLALYLTSELLLTEDSATSMYHGWSFSCYFTTIFGAILADSFLGRYRTIFYLSIVYLIGNCVLSLASARPVVSNLTEKIAFSVCGLLLIAIGTGGIKPCVSAFGGDQFSLPRQQNQLSKFFSIFYFSINAGSLLSTLVTPILREDVSCFGGNCFPLAFGIPAILMIVSLVLFLIGTPQYKIKPPEGNVMSDVVRCIGYAFYRNFSTSTKGRHPLGEGGKQRPNHWLDITEDKFPTSLIDDIKVLTNVLLLFIPLPFFWALFDQQGSRWTFQATKMSGKVGSWTIKPDQMQVLNPLLIMILIPLFEYVVYPRLNRWRILTKPLHRMFVGGLFAALAFVISGILQVKIEGNNPNNSNRVSLVVINALPVDAVINLTSLEGSRIIPSYEMIMETIDSKAVGDFDDRTLLGSVINISAIATCKTPSSCVSLSGRNFDSKELRLSKQQVEVVVVNSYLGNLEIVHLPVPPKLIDSKFAQVRLVDVSDFLRLSDVFLKKENQTTKKWRSDFFSKGVASSQVEELDFERYELSLPGVSPGDKETSLGYFQADEKCPYIIFLDVLPNPGKVTRSFKTFVLNSPSSVHMLWILPQYFVISIGEIMFSVTGLEFSFTQAPASMKSVVQASWLMTVAFGNLIVVIVAESKLIAKQSVEFFFFAGLMVLDMLVFLFLVRRYHGLAANGNKTNDTRTNGDHYEEQKNGLIPPSTWGKQLNST